MEAVQQPSEQPASTESQAHALLPLPGPTNDTTKLDTSSGGSTVKMDHLGPLVVNKDGTLSRISNWHEMSKIERQNTMRVLGKRNQLRRAALEEKEKGESEAQGGH